MLRTVPTTRAGACALIAATARTEFPDDRIHGDDAAILLHTESARAVQSAWPWSGHDLQPCLLAPSAIVTALSHEIYRIGARQFLHGGQDKFGAGLNFPGDKPERIERAGMPDTIPPLAKVMDQASDLASAILRGKSPMAGAPVVLVAESDRQATPGSNSNGAVNQTPK